MNPLCSVSSLFLVILCFLTSGSDTQVSVIPCLSRVVTASFTFRSTPKQAPGQCEGVWECVCVLFVCLILHNSSEPFFFLFVYETKLTTCLGWCFVVVDHTHIHAPMKIINILIVLLWYRLPRWSLQRSKTNLKFMISCSQHGAQRSTLENIARICWYSISPE